MTNRGGKKVFLVDFAGVRNIRVPLWQADVDNLDKLSGGSLEGLRERVYEAVRYELAQHHDLLYPEYRSRLWEAYNVCVKQEVGPHATN